MRTKNSNFTFTKTDLADKCGISRPTLDAYLGQEGAPGKDKNKGWNIEDVRQFILKNTEKDAVAASLNSDVAQLKKWDIYERARKSKIANDAKEGALVERAKVAEAVLNVGKAIDTITEAKLCAEWPEAVAGLEVAQARVYGRRLKDLLMAEIRKLEGEWKI